MFLWPRLDRRLPALITLGLLLSGLGAAGAGASEVATEHVLRVHQGAYPDNLDPQQSSFSTEIAFLIQNYEGLTRLGKDSQIEPAAAERWELNDDATVVTFHLRAGLRYSDGTPLTAER